MVWCQKSVVFLSTNANSAPTLQWTLLALVELEKLTYVTTTMVAKSNYRKRSLYYWCSLYKDSLKNAEIFSSLKKCIVINITDYNSIPESKFYHTRFRALEDTQHFLLTEDFEIHFIDLTLFNDHKLIDEMSDIEEWMTFIKDEDDESKHSLIEQILTRKESIQMAKKVLEEITADEQIREQIQSIENYRIDLLSSIYDAKNEVLIETAKSALKEGASVEFVEKITHLDRTLIEQLLSEQ